MGILGKDRYLNHILKWIWKNPASEPIYAYFLRRILRIILAIGADIRHGQLNLRAMSLVYTTLLSLVPLLAISFSVLKAFGVHNQIEPVLLGFLEPLGEQRYTIIENIVGFVDNIKVGILGSVGLGFLLYSVISLLQKIERGFNDIWGIVRSRGILAKFSDYLSVILVGPVLIVISIGMTASARNADIIAKITGHPFVDSIFVQFDILLPYLILTAAFTFVYMFIPNTKVRFLPALLGGGVSAALWKILGALFASFVAGANNYTVIYSAFATLLFFMIWLYLAWLIVLIGASISFYAQNPSNQALAGRHLVMSIRMREWAAVMICSIIADSFYKLKKPWSVEKLAAKLKIPSKSVDRILTALEARSVVKQTCENPPCFIPARPFEETSLWDIISAIKEDGERPGMDMDFIQKNNKIEQIFLNVEKEEKNQLSKIMLKDIIAEDKN